MKNFKNHFIIYFKANLCKRCDSYIVNVYVEDVDKKEIGNKKVV